MYSETMTKSSNQRNVSTTFLLPGTEIKDETRRKFHDNGFVNTYLTCEPFTYPYPVIYLLFQPMRFDLAFYSFMREIQANQNFIEVIDLGLNKILFVFRIPKRFQKDYNYFIKGEYSKLSKDYQKCFAMEDYKRDENGNAIRANGKLIRESSTYYHVFNKTQVQKDRLKFKIFGDINIGDDLLEGMELYDKQDPEDEAYSMGFEWE